MKKIKYILIMFIITIILSGCTIKSNVFVSYDGKTTEEVKVLTDSRVFQSDKYSKQEMIEFSMEEYLAALNFRKYDYKSVVGDNLSGAYINKTYDNICSYFQDTIFNQYVYHHVNCIENDYYYEIKNDTNYIPYCSDCSDWPALDDVTLSITLPVSAEEQNADEIDGKTYIWKYDKNTNDKNFYLKISKSALKQNEIEYVENQKSKKTIKNIIIFGAIIVIIVIIIIIGNILYKKYKENKLDY